MVNPESVKGYHGVQLDKETVSLMSALIAVVTPTGEFQEAQNSLFKAALYNFASLLIGQNTAPISPKRLLSPAEKEFLNERKEALLKTFSSLNQPATAAD
jgi:hypothetical protein